MGPLGLYVHVPFCDARCSYCDFVTFIDRHKDIDNYLDAMAQEMGHYAGASLQTIFLGGGTPTVLSPSQIEKLFSSIRSSFDTSKIIEATVEANPESATVETLAAFQKAGINRISFGLQATQNKILSSINRLHDFERFERAFHDARTLGFDNINIDLIFGLPGQTMEMWMETVERVLSFHPEHISTYALKIEPGTKMAQEGLTVEGDLQADMYLAASERFRANGFDHYEISNFSKPGRESQHNLLYWKNADTLGVGVSSTSYIGGRRFKNTNNFSTYLRELNAGKLATDQENVLDDADRDRESVMLALRLRNGVDANDLERRGIQMTSTFLSQGLASVDKGMYSLTPRGWLLSNLLFQQFV